MTERPHKSELACCAQSKCLKPSEDQGEELHLNQCLWPDWRAKLTDGYSKSAFKVTWKSPGGSTARGPLHCGHHPLLGGRYAATAPLRRRTGRCRPTRPHPAQLPCPRSTPCSGLAGQTAPSLPEHFTHTLHQID